MQQPTRTEGLTFRSRPTPIYRLTSVSNPISLGRVAVGALGQAEQAEAAELVGPAEVERERVAVEQAEPGRGERRELP